MKPRLIIFVLPEHIDFGVVTSFKTTDSYY